jgi:ABC-type transporter Mla subunit MlaD
MTNTDPQSLPPMTGPELAAMRIDAIEARLRVVEAQVSAYGRRLDQFDRALEHLGRLVHKQINHSEDGGE